jgi:hypothetical protein
VGRQRLNSRVNEHVKKEFRGSFNGSRGKEWSQKIAPSRLGRAQKIPLLIKQISGLPFEAHTPSFPFVNKTH